MTTKTDNCAGDTTDREIIMSRVFDAPRELVWRALTEPTQMVRWWGPNGFRTTVEELDLRVGGAWKLTMYGPDGVEYPNTSIFTEVLEPERLSYRHGGCRKGAPSVDFDFTWSFVEVEEGKTKLTIHQTFPTAEARDTIVREYGAIESGKQTLARLALELEKIPVVVERTFEAPADLVWKAITEADRMRVWYFDEITTFRAEPGFETRVDVKKGDKVFPHLWKVTKVAPGKSISYLWKFDGSPGESTVSFELFAEGDKTRLKVTHEGLETFVPEIHPDLARGNFVKGWTWLIGTGLTEYLEKAAV